MIAANKAMLESTAKVSVLHIRDKELNYFYNSCNRVSTQAALIAGFAYSGMMYLRYVDRDICERTCAEFTYPLTVCMSMGFAMLSLWQATLASMFAPGLALRGPPGSMDMAVDQLVEEYHGAMRLVTTSLALFLMTVLLWSWTSGSVPISLTGTLMAIVMIRLGYNAMRRVYGDFGYLFDVWGRGGFELQEGAETGRWTEKDPLPRLGPESPRLRRRASSQDSVRTGSGPHSLSGRSTAGSAAGSGGDDPLLDADVWRSVPEAGEATEPPKVGKAPRPSPPVDEAPTPTAPWLPKRGAGARGVVRPPASSSTAERVGRPRAAGAGVPEAATGGRHAGGAGPATPPVGKGSPPAARRPLGAPPGLGWARGRDKGKRSQLL
mmetsp:Transcript_11368/g.38778  ORF Transcript_11368/g.38778 Transcript_11368/m.38778 type:complete len:379 (-) Transcript_11368:272-1408(-)